MILITEPQLRKINKGLNDGIYAKELNTLLSRQVDTLERISALKDSALIKQKKIWEIQQRKFDLVAENVKDLEKIIAEQHKKRTGTIIKSTVIGAAVGVITVLIIK